MIKVGEVLRWSGLRTGDARVHSCRGTSVFVEVDIPPQTFMVTVDDALRMSAGWVGSRHDLHFKDGRFVSAECLAVMGRRSGVGLLVEMRVDPAP